jgi:hypothetical protein
MCKCVGTVSHCILRVWEWSLEAFCHPLRILERKFVHTKRWVCCCWCAVSYFATYRFPLIWDETPKHIILCPEGRQQKSHILWYKDRMRVFIGLYFILSMAYVADHSGRADKGMNCLPPLERWDRGFESHSRQVCLPAFILCVGERPCEGLIPGTRSRTDSLRLRNWSETKRFTDALCSKWEQQELR